MASDDSAVATRPHLDRDDEAGTAPMDRRFRPDVEGLRAIAILLVVLYHAGVPGIRGGYVGVDVFFVISGFVITGVMLRERQGTGGTSILHFYARRVRRILVDRHDDQAAELALAPVGEDRWCERALEADHHHRTDLLAQRHPTRTEDRLLSGIRRRACPLR